ncbi:MAG: 30S ribosomal protein S6 [Patescibacteria group bacterium]
MKETLHKETEGAIEGKMHVYEVGFVLMPSMSEEKVAEKASFIRGIIEKAGGEVITEDFPKLMPLAYPMDKMIDSAKQVFKEAYFGWVKFEMPAVAIAGVEKEVSVIQEVLRFLIVKTLRENILFPDKVGKTGEKAQGEESSAESIDKSIDALVIG